MAEYRGNYFYPMKNAFQNSCASAKKLAGATLVSASLLLWACAKPEKTPESVQHDTQARVAEIQAPPEPIIQEDIITVQTISFDEFAKTRNDIIHKGEEFFLVLDEEQNHILPITDSIQKFNRWTQDSAESLIHEEKQKFWEMKEKGLVTEYLYFRNYENEIMERFNNNGYTYSTSFEDNGIYPGFRYLSEEKISFDEIDFGNTDIAKIEKRNPFSLYDPYDRQEDALRELFILDAYQTRDMNPKEFLAFIQDRFTKNKIILDMAELDGMMAKRRGYIEAEDYIRQNRDIILQNINKTPQELYNALIEWDEYLAKQMQIMKQVKSLVASWFEWAKVTTFNGKVDIETIIWRDSEGWPSTAYFSIPYYDKNGVLQHEENMKFLEREELQKLVNTVIKKAEERERNRG